MDSAPTSAILPYKALRTISTSLQAAQVAAEGAAPHLVDHAEQLATSVKQQLQDRLSGRLQKALDKLKWPSRELVLNDAFVQEWVTSVDLLLDLQEPYVLPTGHGSVVAAYSWHFTGTSNLTRNLHPFETKTFKCYCH